MTQQEAIAKYTGAAPEPAHEPDPDLAVPAERDDLLPCMLFADGMLRLTANWPSDAYALAKLQESVHKAGYRVWVDLSDSGCQLVIPLVPILAKPNPDASAIPSEETAA